VIASTSAKSTQWKLSTPCQTWMLARLHSNNNSHKII
jgi:hypothetical protein